MESEIADFTVRKTGLIIPYWLADRLSDALELGKEKRPVLGVVDFCKKELMPEYR
jgi:hypothetical protein